MQTFLFIIGGVTIGGLILGIIGAVVYEIRKEQKKEQEKLAGKQPPEKQ